MRFFNDFGETFVLHAVAAHFNNGLIPVALFFLFISILTGNPYFEHTVLHLLIVAIVMVPVSFLSGLRDWRRNFGGGRAPVFYWKIKLSGLLFILQGSAAATRLADPSVMERQGIGLWVYLGTLFLSLPIVVLLGHYGGKLAYRRK
ncbi:hypothetical protein KJB29_03090 [Geobacter grbiciae]|nr:hypothetical protein [Geobacter grbiciae]